MRKEEREPSGEFTLLCHHIQNVDEKLNTKIDKLTNILTDHVAEEDKLLNHPVSSWLKRTEKFWTAMDMLADGFITVVETISKAIRWVIKNLAPVILAAVILYVAATEGMTRALEIFKEWLK